MNIGETIKKLRKQKDMTQEQLAEYLNISPQAISRWEINSTLPDITLVPMLANIFDVTTDIILGVDIDAKEKRIEAIVKEAKNHFFKHQYDEAEKLIRAALKDYPNSYKLMDGLAAVLSSNADYYDNRNGNEEEIMALSEKILAECTDDNLRYPSIQRLCHAYASMGETEKATSFAKKMPNTTQMDMITETLKGTKKYSHMQQQIARSADNVVNSIAFLMGGYVSLDNGTEPYNSDECIALCHKIIDIVNILIEKGSFGDFNFRLVNAHLKLTFLYVQKGDAAAALNHFRLAAKHAVMYYSIPPINDDSNEEYTSLLLRGVKFPSIHVGGPFNTMAKTLLERSRKLDAILPASELEEIRSELRKYM